SRVYMTTDAGATWVDVSNNLFSTPTIDLDLTSGAGTGQRVYPLNPDGTLQTGQTTEIASLAVYDPFPGTKAGGVVLLAGGRGGVFKTTIGATDPNVTNGQWQELGAGLPNAYASDLQVYGSRLVVGTQGRGAWSIPDLTGTIGPAILTVLAA